MEKLTPDLSGVAPRGCAVPLAVLKCIGRKSTPIPSAQKSFDRIWGKPFSRRLDAKTGATSENRTSGARGNAPDKSGSRKPRRNFLDPDFQVAIHRKTTLRRLFKREVRL